MREIKFRGKDLDGVWRYGSLVNNVFFYADTKKGVPYIFDVQDVDYDCLDDLEDGEGFYEIRLETIGEFTGLQDKNGKDIYEGDIVECVSWNEFFSKGGAPIEAMRRRMYVGFRNGGFKMIEPRDYGLSPAIWDIIYNGDIIIVGNLTDNPEILNKEK